MTVQNLTATVSVLILLGLVYSQCSQGQYWDSDTSSCEACHAECLTCSGPNECSACVAQLKVPISGGTGCQYCDYSSGEYSLSDGINCGTCSISNCNSCLDSTFCFSCTAPYKSHLTEGTCVVDCPADTIEITLNNGDIICQSLTMYLDPTSTSNFELGTISHPFKRYVSPFEMILEYFPITLDDYILPDTPVQVLQKAGTLTYFEGANIPVPAIYYLRLATYGADSSDPYEKAESMLETNPDYSYLSDTYFSLTETIPQKLDYSRYLANGYSEVTFSAPVACSMYGIDVTIELLDFRFMESTASTPASNVVMMTGDDRWMIVRRCNFEGHKGSFLMNQGQIDQLVEDSEFNIDYDNQKWKFWYVPGNQCTANPRKISLTYRNNIIRTRKAISLTVIEHAVPGDAIFVGNKFIFEAANQIQMLLQYGASCDITNTDFVVLFTDNTITTTNAITGYLQIVINYSSMHESSTMTATIKDNTVTGGIPSQAFITMNGKSGSKGIIQNLTFDSIDMTGSQFALIEVYQTIPVIISEINAINSVISKLVMIGNQQATIDSITLSGLTTSSSETSASYISIESGIVSLTALNAQDCVLSDSTSVVGVKDTTYVLIDTITGTNNQLGSSHFISIDLINEVVLQNIQVSGMSSSSSTGSNLIGLSSVDIRTVSSTLSATSISMADSSLQFFTINQLFSTSGLEHMGTIYLNGVVISNTHITYNQNLAYSGNAAYFKFSNLNNQKIKVVIDDISITGSTGNAFVSETNLLLEISNAVIDDLVGAVYFSNHFTLQDTDKTQIMNGMIYSSSFTKIRAGAKAALIAIANSYLNMSNVDFNDVYAFSRGGGAYIEGAQVDGENINFVLNQGSSGGAAYIFQDGKFSCKNCLFQENTAMIGGAIAILDKGMAYFDNCIFIDNIAGAGSAVYMLSSYEDSYIKDSSFTRNMYTPHQRIEIPVQEAINGRLDQYASVFQYSLVLEDSYMKLIGEFQFDENFNFANVRARGELVLESFLLPMSAFQTFIWSTVGKITINQATFNDVSDGVLFLSSADTMYEFDGININNCSVTFTKFKSSSLVMTNVEVKDSSDLIFVTASAFSIVDISNIIMSGIESNLLMSIADNSNIFLKNGSISDLNTQVIAASQNSEVTIEEVNAFRVRTIYDDGAFLKADDCPVLIKDSHFQYVGNMSAIYAEASSQLTAQITMQNVTFEDCNGIHGGALYSKDINTVIKNSRFDRNIANDMGGALMLSSLVRDITFQLETTSFGQNKAINQGGAIDYDNIQPLMMSTTFDQNIAVTGYGNDIASYAYYIGLVNKDNWADRISVRSGTSIPYNISLGIFDRENQIVSTLGSLIVSVNVESDLDSGSNAGPSSFFVTNGQTLLLASEYQFIGKPSDRANITFIHKDIDFVDGLSSFVMLEFEPCFQGQYLTTDNICADCDIGYFSFTDDGICKECPSYVKCSGGSQFDVYSGYWRPEQTSISIYECLATEACPGGQGDECATGYSGPLCNQCAGFIGDKYYSRTGTFECAECASEKMVVVAFTLLIIALIIYVAVLVAINIRKPSREKDASVLLRIFINYCQIIIIIRGMDLYWPQLIQDALDSLTIANSATSNMLQISCLFRGYDLSQMKLSIYSSQLLFFSFVPIGGFLIAIILFKLIGLCHHHSKNYARRNAIATGGIVAFLLYPVIVTTTLELFQCKDVEGHTYLSRDFSLECWQGQHMVEIFSIALPNIIVYILGFPLGIFFILRKHKHDLDNKDLIVKFGLFYVGLTDKCFYWEIIVGNARKAMLIAGTIALSQNYPLTQTLFVISVLYVSHGFFKYLKPFQKPYINNVDLVGTTCAMVTLLSATIFGEDNAEDIEAGAASVILLYVVIFMFNIAFICMWLFYVFRVMLQKLSAMTGLKVKIYKEQKGGDQVKHSATCPPAPPGRPTGINEESKDDGNEKEFETIEKDGEGNSTRNLINVKHKRVVHGSSRPPIEKINDF